MAGSEADDTQVAADSQQQQVIDGDEITRDSVKVDGEEMRFYSDGSTQWPSVSTVLDARPTPDKDDALTSWREWQLSRADAPNPDDIMRFKGWRGTLVHYKALNPLAQYDLLGDEEITAYNGLKGWEYDHGDALTQARRDVEWCVEQFQDLAETWGIARYDGRGTDAPVIANHARRVEQYVVERDVEYAGQYDLLYQQSDGSHVLADVKAVKADSVSDLFDKKFPRYGLQLAAYARAARHDVDELQIIWISPDTRERAVIPHRDWPTSWETLEAQFVDIAETLHQSTLDEY